MKLKNVDLLIQTIIIFGSIYLFGAFVSMKFNPATWSEEARFFSAIVALGISIFNGAAKS